MDDDSEANPCFLNVNIKEEHEEIDICIEEWKYECIKEEYIDIHNIKEEYEDNFEKYYQSGSCQSIIENVNDLLQITYNVQNEQEKKVSKCEYTMAFDNIKMKCEDELYGQTQNMLPISLQFHDYHVPRPQENTSFFNTNRNEESDSSNKGDRNSLHLKKRNVTNEINQGHWNSKKSIQKHSVKKRLECLLTYKCFKCKEKFKSKNEISEHLKSIHSIQNYECYECGKCFLRKGHLYIHILVHLNATRHICPKCGKSFVYKSSCDAHINKHCNAGEKIEYTCDKCNRHFFCKISLAKHFLILCGRKICMCSEYEVSSDQISSMPKDRVQQFNCDICNKCFTSKNSFHKHLQIHKNIKHFICTQCGKSFGKEKHLKNHLIIHGGFTNNICLECNKRFLYPSSLNRHLLTHKGIKNFVCTECGKSFSQNGNLVKHLSVHNSTKNYKCVKCGKLFNQKSNCERHMLTHEDIRYDCGQCGKIYKDKGRFQEHVWSHV